MSKLSEYCKKKNYREMDSEYLLLYRVCIGMLPFVIAITLIFVFFGDKMAFAGAKCHFRELTGLYCLGCGGTRALYFFTHLHILKSLRYHPIVTFCYFSYFLYLINSFLYRHNKPCFSKLSPFVLIYIGLTLLTVHFIVRNVLLVVFHITFIE